MWQTIQTLIDQWETWAPTHNLEGQRVKAVAHAFQDHLIAQKLDIQLAEWRVFFGLLVWRELGEAAPLMQTLFDYKNELRLRYKPSLAVTRVLTQRRPRGEPQRDIRANAHEQSRLHWAWWQPRAHHFAPVGADRLEQWRSIPALAWLFKGASWRCPPMRAEASLLEICQRVCTPAIAA